MKSATATPTLDDVAKLAGVSTATVSRCLNTPEKVIEATRGKVQEAVDALGYTPNFAARVMAARRTFTIGAIVPTMENAIFAQGIQAFQEELRARGYTLLVSSSAYKPDEEEEQIRTLVARGADGLLLIGHDREPAIYDYLHRQNVPVLVAWSHSAEARVPSIGFDNRAAMFGLASEVMSLGHTRLAMISGLTEGNDRARLRVQGLKEAIVANGLDPEALTLMEAPYGIEQGAGAFKAVMQKSPRPTAVLCGNDVLAAGALQGASSMGIRVPDDVSVTGFDDIELARLVTPALTTVAVPHSDMGRKAANWLIDSVEGYVPARPDVALPTNLIRRASLGRPG